MYDVKSQKKKKKKKKRVVNFKWKRVKAVAIVSFYLFGKFALRGSF